MVFRPRPPPKRATLETARIPAPLGGVNTVAAAAAMPATDAVYCYNLIAAEQGLRSRLGWREWAVGLEGALDNTVRSVLPFVGAAASGANNRLFAVTSTGIWDVTASTDTPTQLVTFDDSTGRAGYGTATAFATPAGRFLLFCDEANGLFTWSETGDAWTQAVGSTTQLWQPSTFYAVGNRVVLGGNVYECDTAGTSHTSGGPTGTGADIADGTAQWDYVEEATSGAIGPSLADQQLGREIDPSKLAFVTAWKSRVWLVERDTALAWYLDVNSIAGTARSFSFASRAGGALVGLYPWSYDGGSGLDTLLVAISTTGDVVIYQGTDPTSASTFGLKGVWSVGAVPLGRRIATDYGGDVLVLSALGVVPLSRLVMGAATENASIYATAKIANLFSRLVSERGTRAGWGLHIHPADNALVVTVPASSGLATEQLVMSFSTRGWSQYRGLAVVSAAVWEGDFWFGDDEGRVCRNVDYVDGVLLENPSSFAPIEWSVLTAYQGDARQKRVQMLRPVVLSGAPRPDVEAQARYDFDIVEPAANPLEALGGWDVEEWDSAVWGTEFDAANLLQGATGMGRDVAIAIRGSATSRTTLVGVDVYFEQGGLL
jgi:hypothetical protein